MTFLSVPVYTDCLKKEMGHVPNQGFKFWVVEFVCLYIENKLGKNDAS